jgi:hypothetical protein
MEIIIILAFIFFIWLIFKILAALFYTGAYLITLPFKIIFFILAIIICIPLGIAGVLIGVIGIIVPLLPFILLGAGLVYLLRKS